MKILHQDSKKGVIKIRLQTMDDCWHLYNLIEKGDHVGAVTQRTRQSSSDKIRAAKEEKETVFLTIVVESLEFQKFSDRLRIQGIIQEGPFDHGSYHSFNITVGSDLTITKNWSSHQLLRLKEAVTASRQPRAVLVSLDDDEATIGLLHHYGIEEVATIQSHRHGKMYKSQDTSQDYYEEIVSKLEHLQGEVLIVVGPGFAKDHLVAYGKNNKKDVFSRCLVAPTGQPGMTGIKEALKRGIVEQIIKDSRIALETRLVEELLGGIVTNIATYGIQEIKQAIQQGAVHTLLVTHHRVRKNESLLKMAEERGATVHVISGLHESGEKLDGLGGMGALLRYTIQ
jgi:protein pelota